MQGVHVCRGKWKWLRFQVPSAGACLGVSCFIDRGGLTGVVRHTPHLTSKSKRNSCYPKQLSTVVDLVARLKSAD